MATESTVVYTPENNGGSIPAWMAMNNNGLFGGNGWGGGILGFFLGLLFGNGWGGFGAGAPVMRQAMGLMESGKVNTGFTFSNPYEHVALVAIGPTSNGEEFQDTLIHEIHHLAVAIASELGIDLESETPAYIAGDSARALAGVVCELGCSKCN